MLEGENWNEAAFTWKDSVYKFRTAGYSVDYFIDFSISTDLKNTLMRAIDVSLKGVCGSKIGETRAKRDVFVFLGKKNLFKCGQETSSVPQFFFFFLTRKSLR